VDVSGARKLPTPATDPTGFDPRDVATYYAFPSRFDGTGTTIAIVSLYGGYRQSDLETYFSSIGLVPPIIDDISVGGAVNNPVADASANVELVRDIEILGSVAPGARLAIYFASNDEMGVVDGLRAAVTDDQRGPSVVCATWGIDEQDVGGIVAKVVGDVLQAAALRGKVVCALGGRWEGGILRPQFPGTNPYVLACVPTSASPKSDGLVEQPVEPCAAAAESILWPRPPWQATLGTSSGVGGRVPDVSALSDDRIGYRCYANGEWVSVGGPGAAVCIWAALLARLHQALGRPWGMVSDLYATEGPGGGLAAVGTQESVAMPAWRASVGWGSPIGERLLATLHAHTTGAE